MNIDIERANESFAELGNALLEFARNVLKTLENSVLIIKEAHEPIENKQTFNFTDIRKFNFQTQVMLNKPKFIRARSCLR